jgi:hypothetical protein
VDYLAKKGMESTAPRNPNKSLSYMESRHRIDMEEAWIQSLDRKTFSHLIQFRTDHEHRRILSQAQYRLQKCRMQMWGHPANQTTATRSVPHPKEAQTPPKKRHLRPIRQTLRKPERYHQAGTLPQSNPCNG